MVSDKKVALLGLDNAGKTSILTAMRKKFDVPEAVKGLKPTKKIERSSVTFMDHMIYLHDFGGQKHYMDEYLKHKIRYLSGIDLLIYVIDIQDSLRFDNAIAYLDEILEFFDENKINAPIVVMLHKCDPKIGEDPTILKNIGIVKHRIRPWLDKFKMGFYKSNIFEIHTIIQAFSRGISMLYTQNEAVQKFLLDIVDKMENVMALLVFEQNGIEIGSYFLENLTLNMKKKILTLYEIVQRRILDGNMNSYEFSDRLDWATKVSGVIQSFDIEGLLFFVLLILEEHDEQVVIDQFNFFEQSYNEIYEILKGILLDDEEKTKQLNA